MDPWKRRFLLETIISRFHVNFLGCIDIFVSTKCLLSLLFGEDTRIPSLKPTESTWKWMVGILVSFWDGLFSGVMLVSGSVISCYSCCLFSNFFSNYLLVLLKRSQTPQIFVAWKSDTRHQLLEKDYHPPKATKSPHELAFRQKDSCCPTAIFLRRAYPTKLIITCPRRIGDPKEMNHLPTINVRRKC